MPTQQAKTANKPGCRLYIIRTKFQTKHK